VIFLQLLIRCERANPNDHGKVLRVALVVLGLALAPASVSANATAGDIFLHVSHGAVASDSAAASAAGLELLKAGGNAVDAACAAAMALGVVDPFASGLGGGGFALVYLAKTGKVVALDFRETAPMALAARPGEVRPWTPQTGLSVGAPGEPSGLDELVRRFGALSFAHCVAPARRLARGFSVSPWLAQQIKDEIERHPTTGSSLIGKVFSVTAKAAGELRAGDRVARPELAKTLTRLRREGIRAFYRGDIARAMVAETAAAGGVLSLDDLAHYTPVERTPLETRFLGRRVVTMPPPSAGGVILIEALAIFSQRIADVRSAGLQPDGAQMSPVYFHLVAEALKHGFADRARYLGDPDFVHVPLERLLDPTYHHELARRLQLDHVLAHDAYGTPSPHPTEPARDGGTAHISVVDREGNAVALTTTINLEFGARLVAGSTGIVLNDEMDDFTPAGDQPDVFSLAGSDANRAAPGKRPVSSMSPTLVLGDKGVEVVAGAAGGPRIVSATLQILLDVLALGLDAGQAVAAPRIHHQWDPDLLLYEPGVPAEVLHALEKIGHITKLRPDIGKANLILRSPDGLDAAADARSGGAPAGY
jgi:gamma-glutamyltranspeptidase/glutathione hydrolase